MKTFIQYQITPTNTSRAVLRRYKHFDWLHEQLTRKYASVCIIPPLPGKQAMGRYEDDFVSDRMSRLQVKYYEKYSYLSYNFSSVGEVECANIH